MGEASGQAATGGRRALAAKRATGVAGAVACLVALLCCALAPARAAAEGLCTDTWTGPGEGSWRTAEDWSAGRVPESSDVACIGAGKTVKVAEGTNQAGVVQGEGALVLAAGSLELASGLESSRMSYVTIEDGTLSGAGTLDVSVSLRWTGRGTMSGSAATVVLPGASATLDSEEMRLVSRQLVNEGTVTLSSGELWMSQGAQLQNSGTFKVNAEREPLRFAPEEGAAPVVVNTALFEKTESAARTDIAVKVENAGTVHAAVGQLMFLKGGASTDGTWSGTEGGSVAFGGGGFSLRGDTLSGSVVVEGASVTLEGVHAEAAAVEVRSASGTLSLAEGSISVGTLILSHGTVTGAGTLTVAHTFTWSGPSTMSGSGTTILPPGATATLDGEEMRLAGRTLVNETTLAFSNGRLWMSQGAKVQNLGTFKANSISGGEQIVFHPAEGSEPVIVNGGLFEKTEEAARTTVAVDFENDGTIAEFQKGLLYFVRPVVAAASTVDGGPGNPSTPGHPCPVCGDPVVAATGDLVETETDLQVGGRGVGLDLTRTYNSQAAAEGIKGIFGYGWSAAFTDRLTVEAESHRVTLHQADGATVPFAESGGTLTAPTWTQDKLTGNPEAGYTLTFVDQTQYRFQGSSGRLESIADRNGNETTLGYNEGTGRLETITDPAGRALKLAYNAEGFVESATDPMGHVAKYAYEHETLASVTLPGEENPRWRFKVDSSHQITESTGGRGGTTANEYNSAHQLVSQTDPLKRTLDFEYAPFKTTITNKATGAVTLEQFTSADEPSAITRGDGTSLASTESFTYDEGGYVTSATDGDGHTTRYGYDGEGNRTSMVDPDEHETKWEYDGTHDVIAVRTPKGETTTIKRDSHGNAEAIERPAPKGETQSTKYGYDSHGDLESVEDPLKRVWKYEYDAAGDCTAEIDPAGDKRTWSYDEDAFPTANVSPRGNAKAGEEAKYTTKIERDAQERPLTITDPLGHTTKYTYDADGNLETSTDGNGHITTYSYNADDEPAKTTQPNGDSTETEYDGEGHVVAQIDGDKHTTKYVRNILGEVAEIVDPLAHKTIKEYDGAGNLTKLTDPAKRATTYKYDTASRLIEVSYSDGTTHAVEYEYDADGNRTKMVDGTGTTTYSYDQLDRLAETKDGHGDSVGYEYDLADEQTRITYPNGKTVTRTYDKAGRLEAVTDWLEDTTTFAYDQDSDLTKTTFPAGAGEEDKYTFNAADEVTKTEMKKASEVLASLTYTRDKDDQLKSTAQKSLPGEEKTAYTYDSNSRLTKEGTTEYKYDAANNPTKIGASTQSFSAADELDNAGTSGFSYAEGGERTKQTPEKSPATTLGWNQAQDLTSVERPEGEGKGKIEDSFDSNGDGLRASQTINGTTSYWTWDPTAPLPLLLSDGTNSYVFGPGGVPVEQVNNTTGAVEYLHHDQAGSTRLITGSTGKTEATFTYGAYGTLTGSTGTATTPLGYDGQYTSSDTGLIYLRARVYDPATAQFLTVDPDVGTTRARYTYAGDNPLNEADLSGHEGVLSEIGHFLEPLNPIKYYEEEVESYENGCGYFASVAHGLEGAVVGALDASGEGEEAGLAEGADEGLAATAHGAEQLAERGFSGSDIALTKSGEVLSQSDGATVFLKEVSSGRFNVIVEGQRGVVTALKNIPQGAVNRLAQNYGWH